MVAVRMRGGVSYYVGVDENGVEGCDVVL